MKNLLSLWVSLLWLCLCVQAQQLTTVEYYFNNDPGLGNGKNLPASTEIETSIDISGLEKGVHTLYVRAKDSKNKWSLLQHRTFIKVGLNATNTPLKSLEYYFDEDPGIGKGKPIEANVEIETSIDISGLNNGVHILYVRAQDNNDNWSLLQHRTFIKGVVGVNDALPEIAYLEYYIDNDPGLGQGNSLDFFSDGLQLNEVYTNYTVDLSALKDGVHTIYVRAQDSNNHWSFIESRTFIKLPVETDIKKITEIEVKIEGVEPYNEWTPLSNFMPDVEVTADFFLVEICDLPNGSYTIQARAIDDSERIGPITDELFEVDCRIPQITLSDGEIKDDETLIVTGEDFKSNCALDIMVAQFPSGSKASFKANTNEQGNFEYNLLMPDDFETGLYSIEVSCVDQDDNIQVKLFSYEKSIPPLGITIISPVKDDEIKGDQIIVQWNDLIAFQNQYTNFLGLNKQVSYNIYYKSEADEDWVFAKTHTVEIYKNIPKLFMTTIEVPLGGKHTVKVENAKSPIYYDESEEFIVNLISESHQVDFLWDKSFPDEENLSFNAPIGVVSDGVARIILQLNDYTDLKNISRVDVTLSDPKGEATTPIILGKIMLATDDINEYSNEANNAIETSATWDVENYPASQNTFNFWYVAPDDFSKNKNYYYDQARERQVTATFDITFMGNVEPLIVERIIRIVRPPLILAHGLGDSPDTWKNFKSTKTDEETVEFIYDSRFQFKNSLALEKFAHFEVNAKILLGIYEDSNDNTLKLRDNIENSLIDNINKARTEGYACNQVNYVGHSMGGLVIRVATEEKKYPNLFYRDEISDDYPYSNYGHGFVNRLITINSPHNGSEFADIAQLISEIHNMPIVNNFLNAFCVSFGNNFEIDIGFLNSLILTISDNGNTCEYKLNVHKAIENLKVENGYPHPKSELKTHFIAGELYGDDALPNSSEFEAHLLEIENRLGILNQILKKSILMIPENELNSIENNTIKVILKQILKKLKDKTIDRVLLVQTAIDVIKRGVFVYDIIDYIEDSDAIVSINSQLASISRYNNSIATVNGGISHSTTFSKIGIPALEFLENGDTVFNKLNYSDKIGFTGTIPAKAIPELDEGGLLAQVFREIFEKMSQVNFPEINKNPDGIKIIQPKNNDVVFADSLLNIKAHLKDTVGLVYADITFQDEFLSFTNINDTLINQTIVISDQYLGKQDLTVTGIYNYGDSTSLAIETITLEVKAKDEPVDLIIEPAINYGYTGEQISPDYFAVFPAFVSELKSTNTDISVEIENEDILTFNKNNNTFTGKAQGETFAIVKYFDTADTAQFIIYQSYEEEPIDTMDTIDAVPQFQSNNQQINIYPNPAENVLNIDFSLPTAGKVQLEIVDLVGKTLSKITAQYSQPNKTKSAQISLDKIPSGMYILYLKSDNQKVFSNKFIINK